MATKRKATHAAVTHEDFIHNVRKAILHRVDVPMAARLADTKLVYGKGAVRSARGLTEYAAWENGHAHDFIEICADGQESFLQLAGTTIHELAHVMAGPGVGHGKEWRAACDALGLLNVAAAGQTYERANFAPDVWANVAAIPVPTDGVPAHVAGRARSGAVAVPVVPRPCKAGQGVRGGRSRGTGSGSRLRLWVCPCGIKARVASDDFRATCGRCGEPFAAAVALAAA